MQLQIGRKYTGKELSEYFYDTMIQEFVGFFRLYDTTNEEYSFFAQVDMERHNSFTLGTGEGMLFEESGGINNINPDGEYLIHDLIPIKP